MPAATTRRNHLGRPGSVSRPSPPDRKGVSPDTERQYTAPTFLISADTSFRAKRRTTLAASRVVPRRGGVVAAVARLSPVAPKAFVYSSLLKPWFFTLVRRQIIPDGLGIQTETQDGGGSSSSRPLSWRTSTSCGAGAVRRERWTSVNIDGPPGGRESGGTPADRREAASAECPEARESRSRRKRGLAPRPGSPTASRPPAGRPRTRAARGGGESR